MVRKKIELEAIRSERHETCCHLCSWALRAELQENGILTVLNPVVEGALLCAQQADDPNTVVTIGINESQSMQLAFITTD